MNIILGLTISTSILFPITFSLFFSCNSIESLTFNYDLFGPGIHTLICVYIYICPGYVTELHMQLHFCNFRDGSYVLIVIMGLIRLRVVVYICQIILSRAGCDKVASEFSVSKIRYLNKAKETSLPCYFYS